MKPAIRIETKVTTVLIPHIILEAELLQLPIQELSQRIQREVEENPCMEIKQLEEDPPETQAKDEKMLKVAELGRAHPLRCSSASDDEDETEPEFEAPKQSFWEQLESQFETVFRNGHKEREIARVILDSLDGDGLLRISAFQLANELRVPVETLEKARQKVLHFDPPGIAAIDLRELCLVQLEDQGFKDTLAYQVIQDHWDLMEEKGFERTVKELKISDEDVADVVTTFKWLYPSPREMYGDESSSYVYPEVIIKLVEGRFEVEMVSWGMPRVSINPTVQKILRDAETSPEDKRWLNDKMKRALDFFKALDERRANIVRVAEFVVEYQEDFLRGKTKHMSPITQSEAAKALGLSISTLNRVVKNRWADTPVGVYELRSFFTKGINSRDGQITPKFLMDKIKRMIDREDRSHPLTDGQIAEKLKKGEGIKLSRRSVTQYRQMLEIPKCSKRRSKD
jgi:RNA polymerase sigma-54 factor